MKLHFEKWIPSQFVSALVHFNVAGLSPVSNYNPWYKLCWIQIQHIWERRPTNDERASRGICGIELEAAQVWKMQFFQADCVEGTCSTYWYLNPILQTCNLDDLWNIPSTRDSLQPLHQCGTTILTAQKRIKYQNFYICCIAWNVTFFWNYQLKQGIHMFRFQRQSPELEIKSNFWLTRNFQNVSY